MLLLYSLTFSALRAPLLIKILSFIFYTQSQILAHWKNDDHRYFFPCKIWLPINFPWVSVVWVHLSWHKIFGPDRLFKLRLIQGEFQAPATESHLKDSLKSYRILYTPPAVNYSHSCYYKMIISTLGKVRTTALQSYVCWSFHNYVNLLTMGVGKIWPKKLQLVTACLS